MKNLYTWESGIKTSTEGTRRFYEENKLFYVKHNKVENKVAFVSIITNEVICVTSEITDIQKTDVYARIETANSVYNISVVKDEKQIANILSGSKVTELENRIDNIVKRNSASISNLRDLACAKFDEVTVKSCPFFDGHLGCKATLVGVCGCTHTL